MSIEIRTIIEEELLSHVDVLVGIDTDPVVAADHQDLHLAVGLAGVVGEPDLAAHPEHVNTGTGIERSLSLSFSTRFSTRKSDIYLRTRRGRPR